MARDTRAETTGERGTSAASAISLPKGGGAIRGIGEKFGTNPATGTGSLSIPIPTSAGRSGFGPELSLNYDSGAGNGPFGFGWSLSLPAITRKTDKGLPKYQDAEESDIFVLSGAEDLVPLLVNRGGQWQRDAFVRRVAGVVYHIQRYRPRVEGLFARIERWTNRANSSETFWRSISTNNLTSWYGRTAESRLTDPADPSRIFSWQICETCDDKGNVIVYEYKEENSIAVDLSRVHERNRTNGTRSANRYLKRIKYGNRQPYHPRFVENAPPTSLPVEWFFDVVFDYGEHDSNAATPRDNGAWPARGDPFSSYRSGFEIRTYRLCQRVLMFHHFPEEEEVGPDCLVRSTDFTYSYERDAADPRNPIYSFLASVTQSGYTRQQNGGYLRKQLPQLNFEYSQPTIHEETRNVAPDSLENLPYGLDGARYQWADIDGEGLSGILTEQAKGWFYKRNLSPVTWRRENGVDVVDASFGSVEPVAKRPSLASISQGRQQFLDLAGDGQLDLVDLHGATPGFYERTHDEGWASFTPFRSLPMLDWSNPDLKFVDLTGDGHVDVLIAEEEIFTWYPSLAETGFGPAIKVRQALDEEKGPRLVFSDGAQSVYLADMSGDGLTDLVRIRNGDVCYWPSLGYGRFGAKVTMDNAPRFDAPDQFDQRRVRLADIDGSGATDIVYLGRDGVYLHFNQSGNSWSETRKLSQFPPVDDLAAVTVVDLFGTGTACLVWSSPLAGHTHQPMRYIDLMGGQKPHLLVGVVNNLGAETRVRYAPSTKFSLTDRLAGRPWVTRLPFPVHVVERVDTCDRIGRNRFVTRYAYHHGYFDGIEREFRGFGLVEQWDTEEFAALNADDAFPDATNLDAASHVPPVKTKTWFHTGAYFESGQISRQFITEYYREPGLTDRQFDAQELPTSVVTLDLKAEEAREAFRALKGAVLRTEVYGLDGSRQSAYPYSVTQQNYTVEVLQPREGNRHAAFFTHARESAVYHYERNPNDPRVSHELVLHVDPFGNVLQSVAVGYGRRAPDAALAAGEQEKQTKPLVTYTTNGYTNSVEEDDAYRAPLSCETQTYQLLNVSTSRGEPGVTNLFAFAEIRDRIAEAGDGDHDVAYEDWEATTAIADHPYRRLIEHRQTVYRRDDLAGLLPLRLLQSRAVPGESYKLAHTAALIARVYGDRVAEALLLDDGRYVHRDDRDWWIPSGRVFFSPDSDVAPAEELAYAREHFFLPHGFQDPFGNEATVSYDSDPAGLAYDLHVVSTRDAAGNEVRAAYDYRVLQPTLVTDPNGNRSAAAYDALGMVVGTAIMGKAAENRGDSLQNFVADLEDGVVRAHVEHPLDDPHAILQRATTRLVYDLFAYQRSQGEPVALPAVVYTMARETHDADLSPGEQSKVQHSFSYSDGFGREIQKKIQAEPGPLVDDGPDVVPRWVGSGWTIFNNKGKPVREYEPFFADSHAFEFARAVGVSPILFYDPVGRLIATLHPHHAYEKVVFDPWRQTAWDANDTVLSPPRDDVDAGAFFRRLPDADYLPTWHAQRAGGALGVEEQAAATQAAVHAETPTLAFLDTLGRTFLTVAHNTFPRNDAIVEERYETRVTLDIEGNQRSVQDARGRMVMSFDYDLLGNRTRQLSMDAGTRWILSDAVGGPIHGWDSRGHHTKRVYDALRRPTHVFISEGGAAEELVERTVYGERDATAEARNLRGRVLLRLDQAGLMLSQGANPTTGNLEAFDFKGNPLHSSRRLAREYRQRVDWASLEPLLGAEPVDLPAIGASALLENESFAGHTTYDALNRPVTLTMPDSTVIRPAYNEANLLERMEANLRGSVMVTTFVRDIDYNAKGQRAFIQYGNGATTAYSYDPLTFRLVGMRTTRNDEADVLQDLQYTYDPAGNITSIRDGAQQTIHFDNAVVEPHGSYTYDAVYRLISATGREHVGQGANCLPEQRPEWQPHYDFSDCSRSRLAHPNNGQAMRRYTEEYAYDEVGNIMRLIHVGNGASWTRHYAYAADSNRLLSTSLPGDGEAAPYSARYEYEHGNMTRMPHLSRMEWDFGDRFRSADLGGGGTAHYVYDATGQRVRKVIVRQNGSRQKERIYLGGFEVYREYGGDGEVVSLERESVHVMDDTQRIALVETRTQGADGSSPQLIRYEFGNHIGSACLELDGAGGIISYAEYYPYGSTSYQAVRSQTETSTRYRYSGKERDEESGLYYHGARYYASWLARWTSCDPGGLIDGPNVYRFNRNNPIRFVDPQGLEPQPPPSAAVQRNPTPGRAYREHFRAEEMDRHRAEIRLLHAVRQMGELHAELEYLAEHGLSHETFESDTEHFSQLTELWSAVNSGDVVSEPETGALRSAITETDEYHQLAQSPRLRMEFMRAYEQRLWHLEWDPWIMLGATAASAGAGAYAASGRSAGATAAGAAVESTTGGASLARRVLDRTRQLLRSPATRRLVEADAELGWAPGRVRSRINLAWGPTRFTPQGAGEARGGLAHTIWGHFGFDTTQSQFTIRITELGSILNSPTVVRAPVFIQGTGNAARYVREVDVGRMIGTVRVSHGGYSTSWIRVITDRAGNLITAFPIPPVAP